MTRYRKSNHNLTIDGETKPLVCWSEEVAHVGISRQLILDRIKRGWEPELAVYTPPRKYAKRTEQNQ